MPTRPKPAPASVVFEDGIVVACEGGDVRKGDSIEAHSGDDLIGAATLRPDGRGRRLIARIALTDLPALAFPALIRVMNARTGAEIGPGLILADAEALLRAAGPPAIRAAFDGMRPEGLSFAVTPDRLASTPRAYTLRVAGGDITAISVWAGDAQRVMFPLALPLALGATLELTETLFGVPVLSLVLDAAHALTAAMGQIARLEGEIASLRQAQAALHRRLGTAFDLGREQVLLQRLDLFYLLLSERIERATGPVRPVKTVPPPPSVRGFGPAEVDGVGIFEVETDGHSEWRWFGPDATIALRDIDGPVRRVVLYFHSFGAATAPPGVRVATGGASETVVMRSLEGRYALDIPVRRSEPFPDRMLIVHLAFDRHQSSETDPRLLSAVFSGAEVFAA